MNTTKIFLLTIFFLAAYHLNAQHKLSGTVLLEDGTPAIASIVRLMSADTVSMYQFAETNEQGAWEIRTTQSQPVILEYSMFGYGTQYVRVAEPQKVVTPFEVTLAPKSFNLEEVTVKDEAFGVKRSGDTLTFRLTTYTTGAERTLGDVLKRLPGMEIRDGSVYYGGEKITRMLVQGRDIINGNQQLATEGIRADQLEEIKIIENYKESSEQFQTERSEDVAMDVRLKEGELNKWSGQAELLGGYPSSVKLDANAFNLNDKIGISGFAKGNNVGERVLTFRDMMNMVSNSAGRRFRRPGSDIISLVPSELGISDQVQANIDGILNLNIDWDPSDKMKIKGFVMGAYAQRESDVFMQTDFVAENQMRTETMSRTTETPIINTFWRMEWNVDSSTFLEVAAPLSFNTTSADETRSGDFSGLDFRTINNQERSTYNIAPFAKMRRKVGKDDLWRVDAKFQNSVQNGDMLFEDIFPFLSVPISPSDSLYRMLQSQQIETTDFSISSSHKMIWGDWFLQPSAEYNYQDQSMIFDASNQGVVDFGTDDQMIQHATVFGATGGYETDDWEVAPNITLNYIDRNFMLEGSHDEWFPGASLNIVRKFNRAHTLTLNGNYGIQYPGFNNVWGVNEVNTSTQVSTGGYPFDLATKGYSASLRYHNFIVTRRTFIFSNISYNYNEDVISNFTQNFGNYILSGFLPTPSSQNFNATAFMGYELPFFPIRLEPRINYNWNKGFSTNGKEEFETVNESQSYSLGLESRWDFPLNVELGMAYGISEVERASQMPITFESWEPSLELEYRIGNLNMDVEFSYDRAGTADLNSDLYILDFEAVYELKSAPLTLKLQADNVLNLDPRERVRNTFGLNIVEVRRYQVFPGFIVAGVVWQF